jgi:hypothetical protein
MQSRGVIEMATYFLLDRAGRRRHGPHSEPLWNRAAYRGCIHGTASTYEWLRDGTGSVRRCVIAVLLGPWAFLQQTELLKPGKLTAEEFDHMKTHSVIGAHILAGKLQSRSAPRRSP